MIDRVKEEAVSKPKSKGPSGQFLFAMIVCMELHCQESMTFECLFRKYTLLLVTVHSIVCRYFVSWGRAGVVCTDDIQNEEIPYSMKWWWEKPW